MMKAMEKNPNQFVVNGKARELNANGKFVDKKKKPKRSRARVERPKQTYIYASQRKNMEMDDSSSSSRQGKSDSPPPRELFIDGDDTTIETTTAQQQQHPGKKKQQQQQQQQQLEFVRSLGLDPAKQVADAIVGNSLEDMPRIAGSVRVDGSSSMDEEAATTSSNSFAYVLYKPVGWSILGEKKKKKKAIQKGEVGDSSNVSTASVGKQSSSSSSSSSSNKLGKRVKAYDEETDDFTFVEYNEADVLSVLTPEERAELIKEGGLSLNDNLADVAKNVIARTEYDGGDDDNDDVDWNGDDDDGSVSKKTKKKSNTAVELQKAKANINPTTRPSLVSWLKDLKSNEGTPIKGGKNWVALSGATEIDDSGLVLLCPKDRTGAVHVDKCGYVVVVGNGRKLVSRSKLLKSSPKGGEKYDDSTVQIDILSRIKRGRDIDPILTVGVDFPDGAVSSCSNAVLLCQEKFGDGARGDVLADPLDRRESRRLVHCDSMTVTSLANLDDDPVMVEVTLPDHISNYANRRDGAVYTRGSFLGRQSGLSQNGFTNAYREVNGAADGFPGWVVDRYDKWLFVQHEEGPMSVRGPLPSLHDGCTNGVYYLPTKADRSVMGSEKIKPTLLEGERAPEFIPVMENGITYLVNMGESFSTGIFLDQRLQRAYLAEVCNEDTRVLNCFAHTGAFSVAAATKGAKTVSLDLDKKWLDRIRPQMEANGIAEWDGQHDCIYGDCFDWLTRLGKRGEQFDIVILDPPSTSVGGSRKKRWSVKNDMAELVSLAAPLVKSDGLLFTTTNSATLRSDKFATMCKRGLNDAGVTGKLERISPMPSDFVSIGSQPVKNLVWRIG